MNDKIKIGSDEYCDIANDEAASSARKTRRTTI